MKRLQHKHCPLCNAEIKGKRRRDRKSFYYPRRCGACKGVIADPTCHERKGRKGAQHPRYLPIGSRYKHQSSAGFIYWRIKVGDPDVWRYEHRVIMERLIGRPLLHSEHVHHKNDNTLDNETPGNLVLLPHGEHTRLHHAGPVLSLLCKACGEPFTRPKSKNGTFEFCSHSCSNGFQAKAKGERSRKLPRTTRECPVCHTSFTRPPKNGRQPVFCSRACSDRRHQAVKGISDGAPVRPPPPSGPAAGVWMRPW